MSNNERDVIHYHPKPCTQCGENVQIRHTVSGFDAKYLCDKCFKILDTGSWIQECTRCKRKLCNWETFYTPKEKPYCRACKCATPMDILRRWWTGYY